MYFFKPSILYKVTGTSKQISQLCLLQDLSANELAELYNEILLALLDKHCPAIRI